MSNLFTVSHIFPFWDLVARYLGINELAPPTARLIYGERWARKKSDPLELVTLREPGLTWREIATRVGVCKSGAFRAFRTLTKSDGSKGTRYAANG